MKIFELRIFSMILHVLIYSELIFIGAVARAQIQAPTQGPLQARAYNYSQFKEDFKSELLNMTELSASEIKSNLDCLEQASMGCEDRLNYFYKTFPKELKLFRRHMALSIWGRELRLNDQKLKSVVLKNELLPVEHQPLTDNEFAEIYEQYIQNINLVKIDFEKELRREKPAYNGISEVKRSIALQELSQNSLPRLLSSDNTILMQFRWQAHKTIRKLNHSRWLKNLSHHPLLAYHSESQVSRESLVAALQQMQGNLDSQKNNILASIDKAERESDLYEFVDYVQVIEQVGKAHPESVSFIAKLFNGFENKQIKQAILMVGGVVAISFMAPPLFTGLVAIGIQSALFFDARNRMQKVRNEFLTNPDSDLSLRSSEQVLEAQSDYEFEKFMLPVSALTAMPLLRMTSWFRSYI